MQISQSVWSRLWILAMQYCAW